jgi:hypothetical protein
MSRPIRKFRAFSSPLLLGIPPVVWGRGLFQWKRICGMRSAERCVAYPWRILQWWVRSLWDAFRKTQPSRKRPRGRAGGFGRRLSTECGAVSWRMAYPMHCLRRMDTSSLRCPRRSDGSLAMAWVGAFTSLRHSNNFRAPARTVEEAGAHVRNRHVGHPDKVSARRHLKYYLKVYSIVTKYSNGFSIYVERQAVSVRDWDARFPKMNKEFERAIRRPLRRRSGGLPGGPSSGLEPGS